MELSKKIFWYSITVTTSISFVQAQVMPQDSSEKVCQLEHEQTQSASETSTNSLTSASSTELQNTEASSEKTGQKHGDDESAKRVLKYFSQVILHFLSLLSDPKNPSVVKPNLNGMFSGMISIFMEALRKNHTHMHQIPPMADKHAFLAEKLTAHLIQYNQE